MFPPQLQRIVGLSVLTCRLGGVTCLPVARNNCTNQFMIRMERVRERAKFSRQLVRVMRNALTSEYGCKGMSAQLALAEVVARSPDIVRMVKHFLEVTGNNSAVQQLQIGSEHSIFLLIVSEHAVNTLPKEADGFIRMHSGRRNGFREVSRGLGRPTLTNDEIARPGKSANTTPPKIGHCGLKGRLSSREMEILALLAEGCTNQEISSRLFISTGTVRTHLMHIYKKLQVNTRTKAAAKYLGSTRPVGRRA